ncbi:hypothetical protein K504DRAFT_465145 [Pleomassaria siparia CBS 279.74]|uniref:Uncharacterized protein n=1 Tax=Pleomassaria siparia CBS 279.74 TaxID=1314801 RepID=A0A6G1KG43_9PLEO|nr:hypothetical protein K504DRAFT_465145 [Pleomassaria siparia CBS 279.74]
MAHYESVSAISPPSSPFAQTQISPEYQPQSSQHGQLLSSQHPHAGRPSGHPGGRQSQQQPTSSQHSGDPEYKGVQPFIEQVPDFQPAPPKSFFDRMAYKTQRLWLWEIASCWLALACHITLIALLVVYHDAKVSSWTAPWTLGSNIAFLITIIKAMTLGPVASCLGQLKWRRFWGHNRLIDMERFDVASRGPYGSLQLLFHLRFHHYASAGALIMIVALSMDALAQNVIGTLQRLDVTEGTALLPRNNAYSTYTVYGNGSNVNNYLPWPSMISAINYGLSYTSSFFWAASSLPPTCTTGNCTFGTYQSLVVESKCLNISDTLDWDTYPEAYYLPGSHGLLLRKEDGRLNVSTVTTYPETDRFGDIGPLIAHYQAIARPYSDYRLPTAIDCVLYWAVAKYTESKVDSYTLHDLKSSSWTNTTEEAKTRFNMNHAIILRPPECWANGTEVKDATDDDCVYTIYPKPQLALQQYLISSNLGMSGYAELHLPTTGWNNDADRGLFINTQFANSVYDAAIRNPANETYNLLAKIIDNAAIMMTQGVRQLPGDAGFVPHANGTVYVYETFYDIHFKYLGAANFVVGATILFLGWTIYVTRPDHPWKTSSLPLLFHGLSEEDRRRVTDVPHMCAMWDVAEVMSVKMTVTDVGQRLSTAGSTSGFQPRQSSA